MVTRILLTIFLFSIYTYKGERLKKPEAKLVQYNLPNTIYSDPETIVLQIIPESRITKTTVNKKIAYNTTAYVFFPNPNCSKGYIYCSFNQFQKKVSLTEKWFMDDLGRKNNIYNADNFHKVVITRKINGVEEKICLPEYYPQRILEYFKLDIVHNDQKYFWFDCYAFISLITNVNYYPLKPDFEYLKRPPNVGEIVVLANGYSFPESIKHWAVFLGEDQYLTMFGQTGNGAESLLLCMDLNGMMHLCDCNLTFVAVPKNDARQWEGYTNIN